MDEVTWRRSHPHWGELTVRAFNVLATATGASTNRPPAWTLDDICQFSASEIKRWPNAGQKTLREIEAFLASHGRQLKDAGRTAPSRGKAMTKPDDIPQDVWEAARQAFIGMTDLKPEALETKRVLRGDFDGMPMLVIAARAIMAERERCLSIMNTKVPGILGPNDWPNYVVGPIASR